MGFGERTSPELERVAKLVVDAIFHVHSRLGAGLLESSYSICLFHELTKRGLRVEREVDMPINYDGIRLEVGYRIDLLVERQIIIEVKAVEQVHPVHKAQLITYLKLSGLQLGFLVNFNVPLIKDGIERVVRTR